MRLAGALALILLELCWGTARGEDIQQGKEKAAAYAEAHLKRIANLELPPLMWKRSRSA